MKRITKTYSTTAAQTVPRIDELKARDEKDHGIVEAYVSIFGNVDLQGDAIRHGAFTKSLERWSASGDAIPFVWSHSWGDPFAHIGKVLHAWEDDKGLRVVAKVDLDNPTGAQVFRLLKERRVTQFSFAYDIEEEGPREDGANELQQLHILEVGPTLAGANPSTELIGTKSAPKRDAWVDGLERFIADLKASGSSDHEIAFAVSVYLRNGTPRGSVSSPTAPVPTETAKLRAEIEALVNPALEDPVSSAPPRESDAEFRKRMEHLYPEAWAEVERAAATAREAEAAAERIAVAGRAIRRPLPTTQAPRVDPMLRPVG